jgi:aminotransferase
VRPSKRLDSIGFSVIRKVFERASALERSGRSIVHMEVGRPDFDTPEHIKQAAKEALDRGMVHYTSNYGLLELREAIAAKLEQDNGLSYAADGEILVTIGVAEALYLAITGWSDPGDRIVVFEPTWANYVNAPVMLGLSVERVPLRLVEPVRFDLERLEDHISPRTRLILLASPQNPTGAMLHQDDLEAIAAIALRRDLVVISDEIYEKIVYDGNRHVSIASLPGMRERTLVLNGFSKAYSMTGWRLGYVAASRELLAPLLRAHQNLVTCACSFGQVGAIAALRGSQDCVATMVAEFRRRRDRVVSRLNEMPHVSCAMPPGAFYAFPDVSSFPLPSDELAWYLLEEAGVAVVPGEAFGEGGRGHLRISFACAYDDLVDGLDRMAEALLKLKDQA